MNYYEKLDFVLSILFKQIPTYMNQDEIIKKVGSKKYLNEMFFELHLILEKLIDDGYVKKHLLRHINGHTNEIIENMPYYEMTFKGKLFTQEGGYVGHYQRLDAEKIRLDELSTRQMRLQTKLNRLTFWIALGTCVAALYYIMEILKYFGII